MWFDDSAGENNRQARLTAADVREIIAARRRGVPAAEIGKRFGVSADWVCRIVRRAAWRSVA